LGWLLILSRRPRAQFNELVWREEHGLKNEKFWNVLILIGVPDGI
jgi:hypothetical protein